MVFARTKSLPLKKSQNKSIYSNRTVECLYLHDQVVATEQYVKNIATLQSMISSCVTVHEFTVNTFMNGSIKALFIVKLPPKSISL